MEFTMKDFNIGAITVEFSCYYGQISDLHVYLENEKSNVEITDFLCESAIEDITERIISVCEESGEMAESYEPEYEKDEEAG